ncbi:MAG: S8 family peptidase [Phycisphaerae bacterium]|nr:S8 family peptidase [Phycisphaerae bacterium]
MPSHGQQSRRIGPKLRQLQDAFDRRRVELQQTTAGIEPEQVLVIEAIGGVENFANAVKRIPGLEWMGEIDIEEITPDEDFYDERSPEASLSGRLYLVMTNQQALQQLLSLWRRYQRDPQMAFERGLTRFRDVFNCLKDIRPWDIQDRLFETGVIDAWREDLAHDGGRNVRFETELWFRSSRSSRRQAEQRVGELIRELGGGLIAQCAVPEIAYHALLAQLPASAIQQIIDSPETELVKCENIMFFRPVGQMSVGKAQTEGEVEGVQIQERPLPSGAPVVAMFDGLPLENHTLLANRIMVDDPDDFAGKYSANERIHGTAMASLIVHGDLSLAQPTLTSPVYVRPILAPDPNDWRSPKQEAVPDNILTVDLVCTAVQRLLAGEGHEKPVAPTVKVINLSIGDPSQQFNQAMSPLGRLLDWLSYKYQVVFVISAGNHPEPLELDIPIADFRALAPEDLQKHIVKALYKAARNRRLYSPAESVNGLTVGAAHDDPSSVSNQGQRIEPFNAMLPSPVSAFGTGYRRSVKPEILCGGGRQWYRDPVPSGNTVKLEPAIFISAPGNKVASPGSAGERDRTRYCCGTSNASALATPHIQTLSARR